MTSGDPRIDSGLLQLADRRQRLQRAGLKQSGWKVGFGSASGMALLGLDAPIIGILGEFEPVSAGAELDVAGWVGPVVECEIAAIVGRDIPPGVTAADVGEFVEAWAPAFEFADIDIPPSDVTTVLAGNIFHRGYRVSEQAQACSLADIASRRATVAVDDVVSYVDDLTALTGGLASVLVRAATLAPQAGRLIERGDVVLLGSIVPPIAVSTGDTVTYALDGFSAMHVRVA